MIIDALSSLLPTSIKDIREERSCCTECSKSIQMPLMEASLTHLSCLLAEGEVYEDVVQMKSYR